jgi:hypothetical protein
MTLRGPKPSHGDIESYYRLARRRLPADLASLGESPAGQPDEARKAYGSGSPAAAGDAAAEAGDRRRELVERLAAAAAEKLRLAADLDSRRKAFARSLAAAETLRARAAPLREPGPARLLSELYGASLKEPQGGGGPVNPCGHGPAEGSDGEGQGAVPGRADGRGRGAGGVLGLPGGLGSADTGAGGGPPAVWVLPNGRELETDGLSWREPAAGAWGYGSLSLAVRLSGYGAAGAAAALSEIAGAFGKEEAARALAFFRASSAPARLEAALARPPLSPVPAECAWGEARGFLAGRLGIPALLVDLYHNEGLLLADRWGSALFVCEGGRGCFRMNHPGAAGPYDARHPRAPAPPFVLRGSGACAAVTDSPGRALLLKSLQIEAAVLVLGRRSDPRGLLPALSGKRILVAGPARDAGLLRVKAFLQGSGLKFSASPGPCWP